MPEMPKTFKQSYHKTIIDACFQPLTTRFYNQSFERSMFPSLYANLIEGSLAEKLEALIGIHDLLVKYPALLAYTPKTTLLLKTIIILKEKQFPQHVFEAIRVINQLINNQTNATQFIHAGGYVILMDVMTLQSHNILMMSALWTCCKLKFHESDSYGFYSFKEMEDVNLVNKAIMKYNNEREESIDEFIQMCSKFDQYHSYVMPKHFALISDAIIEYIIKAKIKKQTIVCKAFQYITRNSSNNRVSQIIENKQYSEFQELLQKLQAFPLEIMVHYAEFICNSIQSRKYPKLTYFFYSRESSITLFQPLFQSTYNLQKEMFLNYLIAVFKCQKKNVINYFRKKPEMVTAVLQLILSKIQEIKQYPQRYGNSRRKGIRASSNSNVICRALQLSYYLLVNDFLVYWPTYRKYEYLKTTLEIVMIESQWSIAYEVFANQLYMLKKFDEEEFASQLGKLDKEKLRVILKKLSNRPEIEMELKFLQQYLDSFPQ